MTAKTFIMLQSFLFHINTVLYIYIYIYIYIKISEGSNDTEDWSNDAENSALHYMNKFYFKIYSIRK